MVKLTCWVLPPGSTKVCEKIRECGDSLGKIIIYLMVRASLSEGKNKGSTDAFWWLLSLYFISKDVLCEKFLSSQCSIFSSFFCCLRPSLSVLCPSPSALCPSPPASLHCCPLLSHSAPPVLLPLCLTAQLWIIKLHF